MEVTPLNALATTVAGNLSKRQYVAMQKHMGHMSLRNFPNYEILAQEKLNCYPAAEDLTITKSSVKIKLQALMDLTSRRLVSAVDTSSIDGNKQLILTSQWAFDISSSRSIFHKGIGAGERGFMMCVVPLSLVSNDDIIWKNELPSSVSFCRPILFKFMNDTKENVQTELATIEAEINALTPTTLANTTPIFDDEYSSITEDTLASVCQICKSKAIKTNPQLQCLKRKQANKDMQNNGLSSLHAWIRTMESLLEVSYKLQINSWRVNNMKSKCPTFKVLGGKVFVRKPYQRIEASSTCRGRSARTFFKEADYFSNLTKIDLVLLRRIELILQCISSGRKITVPKFREICIDTAKYYMELYPWHHMPSSLHKLLIHGPDFVENKAIIPIGMLCEELTETTDMKFRLCGENPEIFNSPSWNEKFFLRLLLRSDPVLASIQPKVENSGFKAFYDLTENEDYNLNGYYGLDSHTELTEDSEDESKSSESIDDSEDELESSYFTDYSKVGLDSFDEWTLDIDDELGNILGS